METRCTPAILAITLLAAACHGAVDEEPVLVPGPAPAWVVDELEPNDSPAQPMPLGPIRAGETWILRGHSSAWYDPFDGFALVADGNLWVELELRPLYGQGDLDLWIYDPYAQAYAGGYTSWGSFESGGLSAGHGTEFHLVVAAYEGEQQYELTVRAFGLLGASAPAGAGEQLRVERGESLGALAERDPDRAALLERYLGAGQAMDPLLLPFARLLR